MSVFFRLLSYLKPYKATVVLGFACLVGAVVLELMPGLVWRYVVDGVIHYRRPASALVAPVLLLVAIQGADALLSSFRSRLLEGTGQRFVFDLRNQLFEKLTRRLPFGYFHDARTGDLMSRISSDVDAVQDVVIRGTDSVIANFLRLVGVSIIFCSLNLKLGLATLTPILVVGLLLRLFNKLSLIHI